MWDGELCSHEVREMRRQPNPNARGVKSRTDRRKRVVQPPSNSIVTRSSAYIEPQLREAMIAESAYFRSAHRGFEPGHEVDDWLAAESEIDAALARGDVSPLCG